MKITWLRRLLRTNTPIGVLLAAAYLLGRWIGAKRWTVLGVTALGLTIGWMMGDFSFSAERRTPPRRAAMTTPLAYTLTDLGALPGGDGESWAVDINEAGLIIGGSNTEGNRKPHAFLWQDGMMSDLGAFAGGCSYASHINDAGLITGVASNSEGYLRAVVWRNKTITALDVGSAATAQKQYHAFLWQNGRMTDLNDALPRNSGWVLESASSINERGQIVGRGEHGGRIRAFLLTPAGR